MYGKLIIRCKLKVLTGMHIGGSSTFSAIGAVDGPVVRDPLSSRPIVPGSSLKGKLRTLLARSRAKDVTQMPKHDQDGAEILRLFGSAQPVQCSRLQFSDCFISNFEDMRSVGVTEVKTENGIDRVSSRANPRQIERVTAGTCFDVCIVYEVTKLDEVEADLTLLAKGMKLLQMDYLGGHGSRGSGRVSLSEFDLETFEADLDVDKLKALFDEVAEYELLSV